MEIKIRESLRIAKQLIVGASLLVTGIFVMAKLTGHVAWSWWVVFSPLWIQALLFVVTFIVTFVVLVVVIYQSRYGRGW